MLIFCFLLTSFSHFQPITSICSKGSEPEVAEKIDVLEIAHPQVWLHVALLAFEPFSVFFAHPLTPIRLLLNLQWIVVVLPLYEYENLSSISSARHYLDELKQIDCIELFSKLIFDWIWNWIRNRNCSKIYGIKRY